MSQADLGAKGGRLMPFLTAAVLVIAVMIWKSVPLLLDLPNVWSEWTFSERFVVLLWFVLVGLTIGLGVRGAWQAHSGSSLPNGSLSAFVLLLPLHLRHGQAALELSVFPYFWSYFYVGLEPVLVAVNLVPLPLLLWYSWVSLDSLAFWRLFSRGHGWN